QRRSRHARTGRVPPLSKRFAAPDSRTRTVQNASLQCLLMQLWKSPRPRRVYGAGKKRSAGDLRRHGIGFQKRHLRKKRAVVCAVLSASLAMGQTRTLSVEDSGHHSRAENWKLCAFFIPLALAFCPL